MQRASFFWISISSSFLLLRLVFLAQAQLLTTFNLPQLPADNAASPDVESDRDDGRLIVTPYLEAGQQGAARQLAKVDRSLFLNVTSYAGYFTVDREHDSNLFFWHFPHVNASEDADGAGEAEDSDFDHIFLKKLSMRSTERPRQAEDRTPLVLWLQGGPGVSSLMALFTENGPFFVDPVDKLKIRANPFSWHQHYHLLFVDNPAGTGFSYTNADGYCRSIPQVAQQLYKALAQFFKMFPNLEANDFYIAGESFAGKYIPAVANEIYEQNGREDNYLKINLKGIALGNAFTDPPKMSAYSDYAYQLGLIGRQGYNEMRIVENLLRKNYDKPRLAKAYWDSTLHLFGKHSNYSNMYNIQHSVQMDLFPYLDFVQQKEVREALHVGGQDFSGPNHVYTHLIDDFMSSAMHWTERLLDAGLRTLFYNGNWDFVVAYPLSENAFQAMRWSGADEYKTSERRPFLVDGKMRGYVTQVRNFYEAAILNSGHMVPADQPEACLSLIDRFIKNEL